MSDPLEWPLKRITPHSGHPRGSLLTQATQEDHSSLRPLKRITPHSGHSRGSLITEPLILSGGHAEPLTLPRGHVPGTFLLGTADKLTRSLERPSPAMDDARTMPSRTDPPDPPYPPELQTETETMASTRKIKLKINTKTQ